MLLIISMVLYAVASIMSIHPVSAYPGFSSSLCVAFCDSPYSSGPAGPQGLTGSAGPQGPIGRNGQNGSAGPQGIQGIPGTNGTNGEQGPQGPAGTTCPATSAGHTPNVGIIPGLPVVPNNGVGVFCTPSP
ncbi:MAG TPA: hypothetical protein VN704_09275 [Verrucomicrobiae bacterium]|nr:hypothetical protein [Verrucomicrobiae bacterium]